MRYSVLGYNQEKAIELGLSLTDLAILHWVQDLSACADIKTIRKDGKTCYWVSYNQLLEDLPILGVKKRAMYNHLVKLVDKGLLMHYCVKEDGTYSYYSFGKKIDSLIRTQPTSEGMQKIAEGYAKNCRPDKHENADQRNTYYKNDNTNKVNPSWDSVAKVYGDE